MGPDAAEGMIEGDRTSPVTAFWLPVCICFLALSVYMVLLQSLGSSLNGDADDLLKLHEIRTFIAAGNVFDRTLPDILQPEPYVSHWPWIVDLPYALCAWTLAPLLGRVTALSVACFAVPLLLLVPALYCYRRLLTALGFSDTLPPLLVASITAISGFFEFAPNRIDYHNVQIMLFFTALVLTLSRHRFASLACGLVVALAMAISFEFAGFHALIMGIYAFDFVFGGDEDATRLRDFGAGLAAGALGLFAVIVPPSAYAVGKCDTYSAPYALALVLAGSAFVGLSAMAGRRVIRGLALAGLAGASVVVVAALFPQCDGGPYAQLAAHLRDVVLNDIPQEKSFFQRPDFVLSGSLPALAMLLVGALAPAALCLAERRWERPLVIISLVSLLALVQTITYFRYLRYLPFFSSIGLLLVCAALLPPGARALIMTGRSSRQPSWRVSLLIAPGLGLTTALVLFHIVAKPAAAPVSIVDVTSACGPASSEGLSWPDNSIVLSPPLLAAGMLAQLHHPGVIAVPNHPAARGLDRVDRFLDPGAHNPRAVLDESRATHVVVCAGKPASALGKRFSFALSLMGGQPPAWLKQCPVEAASLLRIYSYRDASGGVAACPSRRPAAGD